MKKLSELDNNQLCRLIDARWETSATLWSQIQEINKKNTRFYDNEPEWLESIPRKDSRVRANRIFVNTESVINAVIANPPRPNVVPGRDTPEAKELATNWEGYLNRKYDERNVKETLRKGLRNVYFSRLLVLKPFWNNEINDWDVIAVDPLKVRCSPIASKEKESEYFIEEISDNVQALVKRFARGDKATEVEQYIYSQAGTDEERALIENPEVTYKEAWIKDRCLFKLGNKILGNIRNPYWDWDGLLVTSQEEESLAELSGGMRRSALESIRNQQEDRLAVMTASKIKASDPNAFVDEAVDLSLAEQLQPYLFNYFDQPRKPYIIATLFANEKKPIGRTDMITQAAPLQENVDERKRQISKNAKVVNGVIKVDAAVMTKAEAEKYKHEAEGVLWGKGVVGGVSRESGSPLPEFVYQDMIDSRNEIDNIMAAASAFRGEREGQETKAGRLALIEQSFLRLNEMVQMVDYVCAELFAWATQLSKVRYTERHYAKNLGTEGALKTIEILQDDFDDGIEVKVIPGKTLPEDKQFIFERAQEDIKNGVLSPVDYMEQAGYSNPKQLAKNKFMFDIDPASTLGLTPEEQAKLAAAAQAKAATEAVNNQPQ